MFRQGDLLLVPVEKIPEDLKEVPREGDRMILAHGEATGHAHVLEGQAQFVASDLEGAMADQARARPQAPRFSPND